MMVKRNINNNEIIIILKYLLSDGTFFCSLSIGMELVRVQRWFKVLPLMTRRYMQQEKSTQLIRYIINWTLTSQIQENHIVKWRRQPLKGIKKNNNKKPNNNPKEKASNHMSIQLKQNKQMGASTTKSPHYAQWSFYGDFDQFLLLLLL